MDLVKPCGIELCKKSGASWRKRARTNRRGASVATEHFCTYPHNPETLLHEWSCPSGDFRFFAPAPQRANCALCWCVSVKRRRLSVLMMNGCEGGAASASLPFQLHQQHHPGVTTTRQEKGRPGRQTYKSCDFCARRKRKCDGKLPRCSLCVEKNQAHCHYQLKPPTKPRARKQGAVRRRPSDSTSTCGSALPSYVTSSCGDFGGGVGVGVGGAKRLQVPGTSTSTSVVEMKPGLMSLKRCRFSASPATGMVGMQENVFLGDFFGCLGILPLATESIVRNAMVEVMTAAMDPPPPPPPQQQQQQQFSLGQHEPEHERGGGGGHGCKGEEMNPGWSGGVVGRRAADGNPARCMMWCAIALGALMRGAPIEYVSGYVSLARDALATCFDGSGIENVRAYLMMSFLHGLINDEEKNMKYLSFAMNIVSKLRPGDLPKEMEAMILMTDKMRIAKRTDSAEPSLFSDYCGQRLVDAPPVGEVLDRKDLCNLFLLTDRALSQAFITDMMSQGALGADGAGANGPGRRLFADQRAAGGLASSPDARTRVEEVGEARLPACNDPVCFGGLDLGGEPRAGPAIKTFIQKVLPDLSRLSKPLGRSDSTAGIGGVFYHGNLAYMQAVSGEMVNSFESLKASADVARRYPGIVRFRPHLMHCILAASHAWDRGMYDDIRAVYNSVGHEGCRPAPPFEEWGGMRQLCEHIFCRAVERDVHIVIESKRRAEAEATGQEQVPGPSCSTFDLDAGLRSWAGVRLGSGAGAHSSTSGPPLAEPVLAGPRLAEADLVLPTEPEQFPKTARIYGHGATVSGGGAVTDSARYDVANAVWTNGLAAPPPASCSAAAAVSVGWPGATAVKEQEQPPVAHGVEATAPELPLAFLERESGARQEDLGMTDADLLDISAVLMSEDGPLDELV